MLTLFLPNSSIGKVLKKSLESLFSTYGTVLSVTAHSNLRMRGQAFVAFDSKEPAAKAVSEVVGFPLYGKPMVRNTRDAGMMSSWERRADLRSPGIQQLAFAKTKSDSVVALTDDKVAFEAHKKERKEHKVKQRREYMHQKRLQKRAAEHGEWLVGLDAYAGHVVDLYFSLYFTQTATT
jgi:U2 small nuclear ribonucleoprotein B''